jgi:hypothetical protein
MSQGVHTVDSWLTVVEVVVIRDVQQHTDGHDVYDDMALVVAKHY